MVERRLIFALINAKKNIPLIELIAAMVVSFKITRKQSVQYIRNFIERKKNVDLEIAS